MSPSNILAVVAKSTDTRLTATATAITLPTQ
jgi:hypothetical protein